MNATDTTLNKSRKGGVLIPFLIFFIIIMVGNFGYNIIQSNVDSERLDAAEELRVISQQISNNASQSVGGNIDAFKELADSRNNFDRNFVFLQQALLAYDFQLINKDEVATALKNLNTLWADVRDNSDSILESRKTVLDLHDVAKQLEQTIPQLQAISQSITSDLIANGARPSQVSLAATQELYAERLVASVKKVLSGEEGAKNAADDFRIDVEAFGRVVKGMLEGDSSNNISRVNNSAIRTKLGQVNAIFRSVSENSGYIINSTAELFKVHEASDEIFAQSTVMLDATTRVKEALVKSSEHRIPGNPLISAVLLLIVMFLLGAVYLQQRRAEREQLEQSAEAALREKEQNERNQEAIIRLLDEMEGLADGDLTAHATVTEDFTGAIADAMNYTIDQLRSLVSAINNTVGQVSTATSQSRGISAELADAAKVQADEITGASSAIIEMAQSIEQVSNNAKETSELAQESVAIAKSGGDVVRNSIRAMDTIREQIQETSKRIKRLGESSQEIGDIVALINDISDQTNILALNAAIQATMAGEAGRGFAVVSDEVQRLAERSGNAAKQIEGLVKTIQTDTNQAVISMESSTAEVVTGARLAQDAGVALERIESVSHDLAGLIQNISDTARQQAASAGKVTETMKVIQNITTNTAAGTEQTAKSIDNLAELASELKNSVSGFKLPS
jgi:twitching motility protein PilJ